MRRHLTAILLITLALLTSCQSYTTRQALNRIELPQVPADAPHTKYSTIVAEEQEALRISEEISAQQQVVQLTAQIESLEHHIALLEGDDTTDRLLAEISQRNETIELLNGRIDALTDEIDTLVAQIDALSERSDVLLESLQIAGAEHEISLEAASVAQTQWENTLSGRELEIKELTEELAVRQDQITELERIRATLTAQLAQANAALDEEMRIKAMEEQQRIEEVQRQAALDREEAARLATSRAEEEARLAREQELARQLPPADSLTYPHRYTPTTQTTTVAKGTALKSLLLPLSDVPWQDSQLAQTVAASISDLHYPVIFLTGAMENVIEVVRQMKTNAVLLQGGAIITTLAIVDASPDSIAVDLNAEQTMRLSVANLIDYSVFEAFGDETDRWQTIQKEITPERKERLLAIANAGSVVEPTLLASSLYEPSYQDWNTFSPIIYRQTDYLWPLAAAMEDENFYDVYRMTHFSAATDSGNTFVKGDLEERIDYLFARKMVPLTSTILPIGGLSAPQQGEVARWGIAATFLVP